MELTTPPEAAGPQVPSQPVTSCWRLAALKAGGDLQWSSWHQWVPSQLEQHTGELGPNKCAVCLSLDPRSKSVQWVRVTPTDGNTFFALIRNEQTVGHLKQQICSMKGVPVDNQRLIYKEHELQNEQNLTDLYSPSELRLRLMMPDETISTVTVNATRYRVPIRGDDTLETLKSRIQKVSGIECGNRDLVCNGRLLDCDSEVLPIREEAVIDVLDGSDSSVHRIFLKSPGKKEIQVEFREASFVLFREITHIGYPRFTFQGQDLPIANLTDAKLQDAIVIFGEVLLSFTTTALETVQVAASLDSPIHSIREVVADELGTSPDCITLVYAGEILQDEYVVSDCGIQCKEDIEVLFPYNAHLWVQVGNSSHLVHVTDCHYSLESLIRTTTDEPFDYVLINGQLLDEKLPLKESQVYPGAAVILLTQSMFWSLRPIRTSVNTFYCCRVWTSRPYRWRMASECCSRLKSKQFRLLEGGYEVKGLCETRYLNSNGAWELVGLHEQCYIFRYRTNEVFLIPFSQDCAIIQVMKRLQQERQHFKPPIALYYKGSLLQPERTLQHIKTNGYIDVSDETSVFVLLTSGGYVHRVDLPHLQVSVGEFRTYCKGFLSQSTVLSTATRCLRDSETLMNAGVGTGQRIYALKHSGGLQEFLIPPAPPTNFVVLKLEDESSFIVRYRRSESCAAVVAGIEALVQLPSERFILIYVETVISKTSSNKLPNACVLLLFSDATNIGSIRDNNIIHYCRVPSSWIVNDLQDIVISSWERYFSNSKERIGHRVYTSGLISSSNRLFLVAENKSAVIVKRPGLPILLVPIATSYRVSDLKLELKVAADSRIYSKGELLKNEDYLKMFGEITLLEATDVCVRATSVRSKATVFVPEQCSICELCDVLTRQLFQFPHELRMVFGHKLLPITRKSLRECGIARECRVIALEEGDELATVTTRTEVKSTCFAAFRSIADKRAVFAMTQRGNGSLISDPATPAVTGEGKYFYTANSEQVVQLCTPENYSVAFIVPELTVQSLVKTAAERLGLSASQLSFRWSVELTYIRDVSDFQFTEGDVLHCLSNGKEETTRYCNISLVGFRTKKNMCLPFSTPISHLKKAISSAPTRLFVSSEELSSESLLGDYFREEGGKITVALGKDSVVTVSCPAGNTVTQPIPPNTSVRRVKAILESTTSIPKRFQSLFCGDKELHDTDLIEGSDVSLQLKVTRPLVIVESVDEAVVHCTLPLTTDLQRLKATVKDKLGISEDEQRLYFRGSELTGNSTLEYYGVFPGAKVTVLRPSDIHLRVQTPLSPPLSLYLEKSSRIERVKEMILQHFHTPMDRIIWSGVITESFDLSLIPRPQGYLRLHLTVTELPADTIILILENPPYLSVPLHVLGTDLVSAVKASVKRIVGKVVKCIRYQRIDLDENQEVKETKLQMFSIIEYISVS